MVTLPRSGEPNKIPLRALKGILEAEKQQINIEKKKQNCRTFLPVLNAMLDITMD